MIPSASPRIVPIAPSRTASPRIMVKIWRRVAPSERMMPITGRRWITLKVTVL